MIKQVYVEKTEDNAILVCKDNHYGVVVQVVMFVDKLVPVQSTKELTNVRSPVVIREFGTTLSESGSNFNIDVQNSIAMARKELASIRAENDKIEGLMSSLLSQNKGCNDNGTERKLSK